MNGHIFVSTALEIKRTRSRCAYSSGGSVLETEHIESLTEGAYERTERDLTLLKGCTGIGSFVS